MTRSLYLFAVLALLLAWLTPPHVGHTQVGFEAYTASLKRQEVNVRAGPGTRYPILWVFQRQNWPVKVIAKFDNWLKIKDIEGEEGWVYVGMVSRQPTAVVSNGNPAVMYKDAENRKPLYRLQQGVVVQLETCNAMQCEVEIRGTAGWVKKERLISFINAS